MWKTISIGKEDDEIPERLIEENDPDLESQNSLEELSTTEDKSCREYCQDCCSSCKCDHI